MSKSKVEYRQLKTNQQMMFSVLRGITRLVFTPPCETLVTQTAMTYGSSSSSSSSAGSLKGAEGYPETMYLDTPRLASLSREAADLTVLYMFTMLYRQLTCSSSSTLPSSSSSYNGQRSPLAGEFEQLKSEIRAIAGGHLSQYLVVDEDEDMKSESIESRSSSSRDKGRRSACRKDVVLQIVAKAQGCLGGQALPNSGLLTLAEQWARTHMRPGSRMHELLRSRLYEVIFGGLTMASTCGDAVRLNREGNEVIGASCRQTLSASCAANGLEPLAPEIAALVGKLSRLAGIHLNTYLALYEESCVLESGH
jgi:hypothetical protein